MTKKKPMKKNEESTKKTAKKSKKKRTKKYKKIKNIYLRIFFLTTDVIARTSFKGLKIAFNGLKRTFNCLTSTINSKRSNPDSENYKESKVFANRCIIITTSIILLSIFFVFIEKNMLYAYPLCSCILPFIKYSEGINYDPYNEYKDLALYNKIIKINILCLAGLYVCLGSKIWLINPYMIFIFVIPIIIGNLKKESEWKLYQ